MRSAFRFLTIILLAVLVACWWWRGMLHWPPRKPSGPPASAYANPGNQAVLAAMQRPVSFSAGPTFADTIENLRSATNMNIFVNWRALGAAGIDRTAPSTARFQDVELSKALETILKDVGGGSVKLGYTIDEGVITISTEEDLASNAVTRVYDVRDLLPFRLVPRTVSTRSGGQTIVSSSTPAPLTWPDSMGKFTVDGLIQLLTDRVEPKSWKDHGGRIGSIRELSGQLIVTHNPSSHRLLIYELERLRWRRDMMQFSFRLTLALVCALASAILLELFLRWRRRRAMAIVGHCPHCGYDLRATPDRCPECGRAAAATSSSTVSGPIA